MKTTNVHDHAKSDQHGHAMNLHRRELVRTQDLGAAAYAPIAQASSTLSTDKQSKLRVKFDIAFFIASKNLPFAKYIYIHISTNLWIERTKWGKLGPAYMNNNACKRFVHYIAESNRQTLITTTCNAQFFSLLIDGSTDKSNSDNELVMVVWYVKNCTDKKIYTQIRFLTGQARLSDPFQSPKCGLQDLGICGFSQAPCRVSFRGVGGSWLRSLKSSYEPYMQYMYRFEW